jgi:DNA-binding transcriptional regulator YiaG
MACPKCGSLEEVRTERTEQTGGVEGIVAEVVLAEVRCGKCGRGLALAGNYELQLAYAQLLADVGKASGWAFSVMREALSLSEADLASLLGVRRETISRWESRRNPQQVDRAAWIALTAIVEDEVHQRRTTVHRLLTTTRPEVPNGPVRVVAPLGPTTGRPPIPTRLPDGPTAPRGRPGSARPSSRRRPRLRTPR